MPAFFEYLRNITYYLIFATVAGIFAPAGKYKKFVSLVLGFVLLLLLLRPLAGFGEAPITQWFAGVIPQEGALPGFETTYADWRDMYLREAFEAQLSAQVTGLLAANGFTVHSAEFTYSEDFSRLTSLSVNVSREEEPERVPFIRIRPVQINPPETRECPTAAAAKNLLSEFYSLPKTHIHVTVTT